MYTAADFLYPYRSIVNFHRKIRAGNQSGGAGKVTILAFTSLMNGNNNIKTERAIKPEREAILNFIVFIFVFKIAFENEKTLRQNENNGCRHTKQLFKLIQSIPSPSYILLNSLPLTTITESRLVGSLFLWPHLYYFFYKFSCLI